LIGLYPQTFLKVSPFGVLFFTKSSNSKTGKNSIQFTPRFFK